MFKSIQKSKLDRALKKANFIRPEAIVPYVLTAYENLTKEPKHTSEIFKRNQENYAKHNLFAEAKACIWLADHGFAKRSLDEKGYHTYSL